jgi:hypothetical protein
VLNVIVEDILSQAVMQRLLDHIGLREAPTFRVMRGNGKIREGIQKFSAASRVSPHIVLTDLDRFPCPPALIKQWNIGRLPETMLLRVAVHEVEAWLMADRAGFAGYLQVAQEKVPFDPETEIDPKQCLFSLVRRSRKRRLRDEILPTSGAHIGPLYNEYFCRFASEHWRIEDAVANAPSLARSLERLTAFCRDVVHE